jgi:hypothetical protein
LASLVDPIGVVMPLGTATGQFVVEHERYVDG